MDSARLLRDIEMDESARDLDDRRFMVWLHARELEHIDRSFQRLKEFFMSALDDLTAVAARLQTDEAAEGDLIAALRASVTALNDTIANLPPDQTAGIEAVVAQLTSVADAAEASTAAPAAPPVDTPPADGGDTPPVDVPPVDTPPVDAPPVDNPDTGNVGDTSTPDEGTDTPGVAV